MYALSLLRRSIQLPLCAALTSVAVLLSPMAAAPGHAQAADPALEEDELAGVSDVVVAVQPGVDVSSLAADFGLTVLDGLTRSTDTFLLRAPAGTDMLDLAARLSADPRTRFAEPDFRVAAPEANPSYAWGQSPGPQPAGSDAAAWTDQEALRRLGVGAAHATSTGSGVTVAVLDTGVSGSHPSLEYRLAGPGMDVVDGDSAPDDVGNGLDDDGDGQIDEATGHGTHVAGIVAAVAPEASILPVRVLDSDGVGSIFTLADGLRRALASGADVVNMSLGTRAPSQLLAQVMKEAGEGAVVVASAGNSGTTDRQYPAADEGVVSVASVDAADARSVFSNHGWVDVAAPGESIVSTFPGDGYATWGGTSMAAPFVAGQAALLLPGEAAAEKAVSLILGTALPGDPQLGGGRVDVAASVLAGTTGEGD